MENIKKNKKSRQHNLLIALWIIPFVLIELLLVFNLIFKVNKDNVFDFIFAILLVAILYIPGIIMCFHNKKNNVPRRSVLYVLFQTGFVFLAFVGLLEASFDSNLTVKQVNNFIQFIKGEKDVVYMESFEIEIKNKKDEYEIGDIIEYDVIYTPKNASQTSPVFSIDSEIVQIDTYAETIKCMKNGTVNIHFYDSHNNEISYDVEIVINSIVVQDVIIPIDEKDIFLNIEETYQLPKPNIYPEELSNEKVTYSSSNESIAVVDENGLIKALKEGHTIIRCTAGDVTDEVYVAVKPITTLTSRSSTIKLYPTYANRGILYLSTDNEYSFQKSYLSFEYECDLDLDINYSRSYSERGYFTAYVCNNDETITQEVNFDLYIHYTYPGGYRITEVVNVTLLPYDDITILDIDLTMTTTSVDFDIYYDNSGLITKYVEIPIFYNTISKKNVYNTNFVSETLDIASSDYNKIIIDLDNIDKSITEHKILYYPSLNLEEFIEFNINLNFKEVTSAYSGFEMNQLYEISENKKNEIWSEYFNRELFEDFSFKNIEYQNSGLIIELAEESQKYLDFEISKYGTIKKLEFKNTNKLNFPKNHQLIFTIYSLYEYERNPNCKKYTYIIDIVVDFEYIVANIDGYERTSDEFVVTIKAGETINAVFELVAELENKTVNTKIVSTTRYNALSENTKIAAATSKAITGYTPGITVINVSPSTYYYENRITYSITINVVDEFGNVPLDDKIIIDVVSYKEECKPNLDKKYVSTGTVLKLSMLYNDNFTFISSDQSILSIEDNSILTAHKQGTVTIIAVSNENKEITYSYQLKVYDYISPFEVEKGDFSSIEFINNTYVVNVKTDKIYKFTLSNYPDGLTYKFKKVTDSEYFDLDETGSVIISKDGTYTGTIQLGDDDNPYKQTIEFQITANKVGLASTILYFVRKAVGHFGLFLVIGIFSFFVFIIFNNYKHRFNATKYIGLIIYGPILAYTTELIQKLTPTRTYSLNDVAIDIRGYIAGLLVMIGLYVLYKVIKHLILKKKVEN